MVNLLISTFTWLLMKKIQFICRTQRSSKNNRVTTELRSTSVSRTCCCSIFYFILGLNFCKHCHTFLYRKTKERKLKPRIKLNHNKHMQLLNIHFLFMITVTHALKVPMDYMFLLSIRHTLYSRKFLCTAKIKMIFQQKKYDDISKLYQQYSQPRALQVQLLHVLDTDRISSLSRVLDQEWEVAGSPRQTTTN